MKQIRYWFPVVYLDEGDPEDSVVVQEEGKILPWQLDSEPYEMSVKARGHRYHLVFGHKVSGMYLCIPDRNIGCELSNLSDWDENMDCLLKTDQLDYEESTAIAWALFSIGSLLRLLH